MLNIVLADESRDAYFKEFILAKSIKMALLVEHSYVVQYFRFSCTFCTASGVKIFYVALFSHSLIRWNRTPLEHRQE